MVIGVVPDHSPFLFRNVHFAIGQFGVMTVNPSVDPRYTVEHPPFSINANMPIPIFFILLLPNKRKKFRL